MLRIKPNPLSVLQMQLGTCLEQLPEECRDHVTRSSLAVSDEQERAPFVELAHREIPAAEIDRLLGYAGIASANGPIGLDADFMPYTIGPDRRTQFLLFPLAGLERHLIAQEPRIVDALQAFERGDSMTVVKYLTGGLLACIEFCRTKKQALFIRW